MERPPTHALSLRVYYEDTDFSGRVYHASYLRFMERGRTEWLRELGVGHRQLAGESGVVFAVRSLSIDYRAPALMDDWLEVVTNLSTMRGASFDFDQAIWRDGRQLASALVKVACLRGDKPARIPEALRLRFA
jgi:acyl-CoA thioester hydrolase